MQHFLICLIAIAGSCFGYGSNVVLELSASNWQHWTEDLDGEDLDGEPINSKWIVMAEVLVFGIDRRRGWGSYGSEIDREVRVGL